LPIQYRRLFHPKGTAFTEHARVNIDQILASRSNETSASGPYCQTGNDIKEADLQDAMDVLKATGDNDQKDNCCGGGVLECGPLLAENGTASVSLCGSTKQCMGCGQVATMLEDIISKCTVNDAMGGANETIAGKQGLSLQVAVVDSR
jgi:hypothetical protein